MEKQNAGARTIKSVECTCEILKLLVQRGDAGVTEVAQELAISKTTAYNHLCTLKNNGYVVQEGERYRPSFLFLYQGKQIQTSNVLYRTAKPTLDKLAKQCGEFVHLLIEEAGQAIYLYKAKGEKAVGNRFPVGQRDHLHHSAAGKAILSQLPENRVHEIIERHGLPKLTENTITSEEKLMEELAHVRERGYSLNLQEELNGVHAVGVPIMDNQDSVVGAVSISGPTARLPEERLHNEMADDVENTVNVLEIQLNTQDNATDDHWEYS